MAFQQGAICRLTAMRSPAMQRVEGKRQLWQRRKQSRRRLRRLVDQAVRCARVGSARTAAERHRSGVSGFKQQQQRCQRLERQQQAGLQSAAAQGLSLTMSHGTCYPRGT